jgi:predicted RNA polymerase sigma factor
MINNTMLLGTLPARSVCSSRWGQLAGPACATPIVGVDLAHSVAGDRTHLCRGLGIAHGPPRASNSSTNPPLRICHRLPGVRGGLLAKLGRLDDARAVFERAASLTRRERERTRFSIERRLVTEREMHE